MNGGMRIGCVLAGCLAASLGLAATKYSLKDLGVLNGHGVSWAYGISPSGSVVGNSAATRQAEHAYVYTDGAMVDLGTLGGDRSEAFGINNAGCVVGRAETAKAGPHAFLYDGRRMLDVNKLLDASGAKWNVTYATAINDSGQIAAVAYYGRNKAVCHAVLLTPNDLKHDRGRVAAFKN
jgi:probable HAF family extracellular repeat protein